MEDHQSASLAYTAANKKPCLKVDGKDLQPKLFSLYPPCATMACVDQPLTYTKIYFFKHARLSRHHLTLYLPPSGTTVLLFVFKETGENGRFSFLRLLRMLSGLNGKLI